MPRKNQTPADETTPAAETPAAKTAIALTVDESAIRAAYPEETITYWKKAGFKLADVPTLEEIAANVIEVRTRTGQAIVHLGLNLLTIRDNYKYGSWGAFLERARLTRDSADNYIAAARAVTRYPALESRIGEIAPTALYELGSNRRMSDPVAERIIEVADKRGGVELSDVKAAISDLGTAGDERAAGPKEESEEARAARMGFHYMDFDPANTMLSGFYQVMLDAVNRVKAAGMQTGTTRASREYQAFLTRLSGKKEAENNFETILADFLPILFMLEESIKHNAVDFDSADSESEDRADDGEPDPDSADLAAGLDALTDN